MTDAWYQQLVDVLGTNVVFSVLSSEERWLLARVARRVTLEDGELLWSWHERGDGVAVVLEGALLVQRTFEDDTTVVFRRLGPGEALGFSTLAGEPHSADIAGAERAVVAILPRTRLRQILMQRGEIALAIIGHLGHLVALLSDEKTTWRKGSVEQRVCAWLRANAHDGDTIEITHAQMAKHIKATRASVTRALGRLAEAGVTRLRRGRIEVLALSGCAGTGAAPGPRGS